MREGTISERVFAVLGVGSWALFSIANLAPPNWLALLSLGGLVLSLIEFRRWQTRQPALKASGKRRFEAGRPAIPGLAWFGVGALATQLVLAVVVGIIDAVRGSVTEVADIPLVVLAATLLGGFGCQFVLSRRLDAREAVADRPPPQPAPAASGAPTVAGEAGSGMLVSCRNCGAWVAYASVTCPSCGLPVRGG